MKHKFSIFISISAVSVFSFLGIAKNTPGHKHAGSDQRSTTPQNVRAVEGLTLFEQYALNADMAITARIRDGINARKGLSVNARNVNIITTGGKIVLKGVVIKPEEKRLIGDIAIGIQRRENVDNQLVVKPSLTAETAPAAASAAPYAPESAPSAPTAPTALRVVQ